MSSWFQSTLPHGERQQTALRPFKSDVSIHAPTWGATTRREHRQAEGLFQSTLPHGERHIDVIPSVAKCGFNPRSHMGSDTFATCKEVRAAVSIHAPTWGATACKIATAKKSVFQSTLPHGERHGKLLSWSRRSSFNPRSHMGSDDGETPKCFWIWVSIHAPTWGATVHSLYFSFTMSYNTIFAKEPNVIIYI